MKTIDIITDILIMLLAIIYIILIIIIIIIYLKPLYKPKKYYKIKYIFDGRGKSEAIFKARTPKHAIDKLICKYQRDFSFK